VIFVVTSRISCVATGGLTGSPALWPKRGILGS
jgi:hypothetical protein